MYHIRIVIHCNHNNSHTPHSHPAHVLTFSVPIFPIRYRLGSLSLLPLSLSPLQRVSGGMYHLLLNPLPRLFSNFSSNLRSAENVPCKTQQKNEKKNEKSCKFYQYPASLFNFVRAEIRNYQPYLIVTFHPPQSSCAGHDMCDVRSVDRMCDPGTSRDVNQRVECVRLSQRLNECRLDNVRDKRA